MTSPLAEATPTGGRSRCLPAGRSARTRSPPSRPGGRVRQVGSSGQCDRTPTARSARPQKDSAEHRPRKDAKAGRGRSEPSCSLAPDAVLPRAGFSLGFGHYPPRPLSAHPPPRPRPLPGPLVPHPSPLAPHLRTPSRDEPPPTNKRGVVRPRVEAATPRCKPFRQRALRPSHTR